MKSLPTLALLLGALAFPAAAQTIKSVNLEPAAAKTGGPVKITVAFDNAETPNCNVRLHFGDKQFKDFKINQAKDVPLVASHSYAKAGDYTVKAEGKTALPLLKCNGANQSALLKVAAPPPPPPAAASAPMAATASKGSACPAGWKLVVGSVNKKSGAYTCSAKAGTAAPAGKADCPAPLGYFENKTKGQFGCRP